VAAVILAARHGAFAPAAVLELRQAGESGPLRVRAQEAGRDVEVAIGGHVVRGGAELPLGHGAAPLTIRGRTVAAAELRISAQRLDSSGAATPLPIVVELPQGASLHMADIGGMTRLAVEPGEWTVVVHPERAAGRRAAGSPLDRL
jgi:hypothetical protein